MKKFNEIYNEILNELRCSTDFEDDSMMFEEWLNSKRCNVISENVVKILNEYVSDPELTPVPKTLLNFISSKISRRKDSIFSISFERIYDMLNEYEYTYSNEFKENLKERSLFNGRLYVISLLERDFNFNIETNRTFNFLKDNSIDDEILVELFNQLVLNDSLINSDAFCSIYDASNEHCGFFKDNGLIFISRKNEYFYDSLEHEMTHFVQKIVGLDKSLSNVLSNKDFSKWQMNNEDSSKKLFDFINRITDIESEMKFLYEFFMTKFAYKEIHQSIKAILNGFQRIYERDKFSFIDKLNSKNADKEEWLKKFMNFVNSQNFIDDYLKPLLHKLIVIDDRYEFIMKNRHFFIVLLYLGFKHTFNDNIDERIFKHFENFKLRDN